jgi:hypothetical protein
MEFQKCPVCKYLGRDDRADIRYQPEFGTNMFNRSTDEDEDWDLPPDQMVWECLCCGINLTQAEIKKLRKVLKPK